MKRRTWKKQGTRQVVNDRKAARRYRDASWNEWHGVAAEPGRGGEGGRSAGQVGGQGFVELVFW